MTIGQFHKSRKAISTLFRKRERFVPSLCNIEEDKMFCIEQDSKLNPNAKAFVPSFCTNASKSTKQPEKQKNVYKKMDNFKPNYKARAKFNIYISKTITKTLISQISESFPTSSLLYQYLDVSIAFQMNDKQMYLFKSNDKTQASISFIHVDLHSKGTNDTLYGVVLPNESVKIQKCNVNSDNMNQKLKWVWNVECFLTTKQIYESYGINQRDLPKSSRELHGLGDYNININSDNILNNSNILYDIKWNNNIQQIGRMFKYNKSIKKLKLELKRNNWIKKCKESWNNFPVVPIIVYDSENDNIFDYWIEWVKLIKISISDYDYLIGISFNKCDANNKWELQSIYLNTVDIANAHRLFGCFESNYEFLDEYKISVTEICWL